MTTKICFKCNIDKPLSDYYKHKQMGDGHLNKCKDCTKKDTKERADELLKDPDWVEKEQARHREKYHRLDYREKHKPTPKQKKSQPSQALPPVSCWWEVLCLPLKHGCWSWSWVGSESLPSVFGRQLLPSCCWI